MKEIKVKRGMERASTNMHPDTYLDSPVNFMAGLFNSSRGWWCGRSLRGW
jgi:hypothetical protein